MGSLSSEQIQHYREHGYVIVPEVLRPYCGGIEKIEPPAP